jgi:hypothetical protein
LALWQLVGLTHGEELGGDHPVYIQAVERAWQGTDPYRLHDIGQGYLYPPPSLLYFKLLVEVRSLVGRPEYITMALSLFVVAWSLWMFAGSWKSQAWYWSTCLFLSAGHIETFAAGQINGLVLSLVVAFFFSWRARRRWPACLFLALAVSFKTTPLVLVLFLLTPRDWRWLGSFGVCMAVLWLAAEVLIPTPHPASSFFSALRWAAQQPPGLYNYSATKTTASGRATR